MTAGRRAARILVILAAVLAAAVSLSALVPGAPAAYAAQSSGEDVTVTVEDYTPPKPPVENVYPELSDSGGYGGSGEWAAVVKGPYSKFVRLMLNGEEVDPSNYTVTSDSDGNTVITLKESYLKTLVNGTYSVVAVFTDGISKDIQLVVDVNGNDNNGGDGDNGGDGGGGGNSGGGGNGGGSDNGGNGGNDNGGGDNGSDGNDNSGGGFSQLPITGDGFALAHWALACILAALGMAVAWSAYRRRRRPDGTDGGTATSGSRTENDQCHLVIVMGKDIPHGSNQPPRNSVVLMAEIVREP